MNRINAIYARQSVDKKDSISIESQIELCEYELKGESYKTYKDKGYSGKNTDRPDFKKLMQDIENDLVSTVFVYKLDRISRSIMDFANMMELFQKHNVEFVSSTEKFDTSTPMGRAMLNICIVFAQLERETIQQRVQDAYYSRSQKGFYMGSKTPYGYKLEPTAIDGVNTKMLVADPEAAKRVKLMYEMYSDPQTSLGDIVRHFSESGLDFGDRELGRVNLANMLRNPVYVRADLDIYEFFKNQGASITSDVADFAGINGCYLYRGRDVTGHSKYNLKDYMLVIAPHEGIISSETWLTCRKKLASKGDFSGGTHKAKNTWLAGKIKCGNCGTGLTFTLSPNGVGYYRCRKRADSKSCAGPGTLRVHEVEDFVYQEMRRKMDAFQTLTSGHPVKANPKLTALKVELAKVDAEIEKLIDTLTGAGATLLSYANTKIEELDARRQSLTMEIADMSAGSVSTEQLKRISSHLDNWDNVSFDDRRLMVDGLISTIRATSESIQIAWRI